MLARLTKYEVLGALASGGMADVWLARVQGPQGFDKLVVLKTIRDNLASQKSFVEMFFNEARVAAMLNHPNCVQIFDVGEENGVSYIAMEFIDGFSLSRVLKRAETMKAAVPVEVIARIAMDAAAGLEHAHTLTDRQGTPLKLVHRDVSPDNVLVSFSGQTKLVDFGIAKAVSPQAPGEVTRSGTLKGKFGYMAPEYLCGLPIDGRADLFALGVVLYRAVTGRKPFNGATEILVSNEVLHATPISPRSHNPQIPVAMETVVMTALEKSPARRFESARAMRRAIERAVSRPADPDDVAALMDRLWPLGDAERGTVRALAAGEGSQRSLPALVSVGSSSVEVNLTVEAATPSSLVSTSATTSSRAPARPSSLPKAMLWAGAAVVTVAGVLLALAFFNSEGVAPEGREVKAVAGAAEGTGGEEIAAPPPAAAEPGAATAEPVAPPVGKPSEQPTQPGGPAAPGIVEVTAPVPMEVYAGNKVRGRTPQSFELEPGPQVIKFSHRELGTRTVTVTVVSGERVKARAPVGRGTVDIRVSPWATVKIDGKLVGDTPLPPQEVIEGRHTIELSNSKLGKSRRVTVQVSAGERKTVRETFE